MKNKLLKVSVLLLMVFAFVLPYISSAIAEEDENTFIPFSYEDVLIEESISSYSYPEMYVGYEAAFNVDIFANFLFGSLENGEMIYDQNIVVDRELFIDAEKGVTKVLIEDYFIEKITDDGDPYNRIWYKFSPLDGYTLPSEVNGNQYVCQLLNDVDFGALWMLPKKGMFYGDTVTLRKTNVEATAEITVNTADLPTFFDVMYMFSYSYEGVVYPAVYDLGDTSSWNMSSAERPVDPAAYHFVKEQSVSLIPSEVTVFYDQLINTKDVKEYNEIYSKIPESSKQFFTYKHTEKLDEHIESITTADVKLQYAELLKTNSSWAYHEIYHRVDAEIYDYFPPKYTENLADHIAQLFEDESTEYTTSVLYNGVNVPIKVKGKIPKEGVYLSASISDFNTIKNEGFDVKEEDDLIIGLDIKIINENDHSEWQPEPGQSVYVTIGLGALGYEEGRIVRFHHKHEDEIRGSDIFIVMNGELTCTTNGFSLFVVSDTTDRTNNLAYPINDGTQLELTVGEEIVYYYNKDNANVNAGTWIVTDKAGAIHYTVHTQSMDQNRWSYAPWIKINALKETNGTNVTLNFNAGILTYANYSTSINNRESDTYPLRIVKPTPDEGKDVKLYIKDMVNTTGKIYATLIDKNGNELSLDGAAFSWTRSDNFFITPSAYGDNNRSIDVARDHSGLVEARKDTNGNHEPITYTVTARLVNGTDLTATYTVYYQSEILNANFESTNATNSNYTFFVNGYPELWWKTTAPGTDNNLTRDIEIGDVTNGTSSPNNGGTDFGVSYAGDWNPPTSRGVQFAELNAEAFGTLYQDIITAPGEDLEWSFTHAPRRDQDWASGISNAMYIVVGPTEAAQELTTQTDLEKLLDKITNEQQTVLNNGGSVNITYEDAQYTVWYHDAGTWGVNVNTPYQTNNGWTNLEGTYVVPDKQYRTRLFFVSEKKQGSQNPNAGNLIDSAKAGIYKTYLIEYYEETFEKGTDAEGNEINIQKMVHRDLDESGEALLYSSVSLEKLDQLLTVENDFLHQILINGANYPYDIRYTDDESIYIENYPGTPTRPNNYTLEKDTQKENDYSKYDIVVQIFVRDTVIAVKKEIEFPTAVTDEQKLQLFNNLKASTSKGYKINYNLFVEDGSNLVEFDEAQMTISQRDPTGAYTGYVAPDSNPELDRTYTIEEQRDMTDLPGLILNNVTFEVKRYRYGLGDTLISDFNDAESNYETKSYDYEYIHNSTGMLSCAPFLLSKEVGEGKYKIAEITVTNEYIEKLTTIKYKAIGNGKLKYDKPGQGFVDLPTETLPFYSGKATGCQVHAGNGATFVGWYKQVYDSNGTPLTDVNGEPQLTLVTDTDGVWNKETNTFKPNANIINADEVTFYAVFETNTITINKTDGIEGQTFVYHIQGTQAGKDDLDMYVSITCDKDGKGSVDISEIVHGIKKVDPNAKITVTELKDWSWRFVPNNDPTLPSQTDSFEGNELSIEFNFNKGNSSNITNNTSYWLNGYNYEKNVHGGQ